MWRIAVRYLWASPTTLLGLVAVSYAAITRGRFALVDGVLEAHGGGLAGLLERGVPIRGGALAITLGHVVLARDCSSMEEWRAHERVHVRQCERWGPLFAPAYLASSLWALARRRDPYLHNWFEREVRALCNEAVAS